MILGEPGVGKTALVEGLAAKLELEPDTVPKRLRNFQIVNLQMNTLVREPCSGACSKTASRM